MFLQIIRVAALIVLCVGFLRGLSLFGATRSVDLYRLFLIMSAPALLCALGLFGGAILRRREMCWWLLVGIFLFLQAGWEDALVGRGYALLALGWSAFFMTSVIAGRSVRSARWFAFGLIAVGVFETLYGLAQAVAGFDYIGNYARNMGRVATGTLFNRNHYAGLLNLVLPITLGVLFAVRTSSTFEAPGQRKPSRPTPGSETLAGSWLALLIGAFMGLAVLLSQSRGGTVTLMLCLILAAVLLKMRRRSAPAWSAAAPWVLLMLLVGLGSWVGIDALLDKFGSSSDSLQGRGLVYQDTLRLIGDHPWLGVGPGMYAWRFRPYQTYGGNVWFDYAHNDYLQTAAEWGVPIALLFWGWALWRFYRSSTVFLGARQPWIAGMSLGCAVSIFSILLHSLVDFNLYIPSNLMVFGSVLGLSWSVDHLESQSEAGA